ncbi:MAG: 1-acyl-sn-glycerol-3-phosphate acyltransferase [Porticoccaceae bacterium]|nr:1-acyl-sn-glycerol-3-phosphate acyltransferase [Porticoccaceae bacterium]
MNQFEDIRPYKDSEVPAVLSRLIADNEFIDLLLSRRIPLIMRFVPWLIKPLARPWLKQSLRKLTADVGTVADFQHHVKAGLQKSLDNSTDGYSFGGLDQLNPNQAYLFISNHRDIALDPAMINLALHTVELDTVRIAIGDNLLSKPFASDLMRVNRSFIVKRSVEGRREKLESLKNLSAYIRYSVSEEKASCWIAQAEGRAKDGNDKTDTALLKMLTLSKSKQQTFGEAIGELKLMPVSISYEYDPCIVEKAKELYAASQGIDYIKGEFEDLDSIQKGFLGYKGRVQVNFGDCIGHTFETAEDLATEVDRQIYGAYQLFPTNIIAWKMQANSDQQSLDQLKQQWPDENWSQAETDFETHLQSVPPEHRSLVIDAYAAPVKNQLDYQQQNPVLGDSINEEAIVC